MRDPRVRAIVATMLVLVLIFIGYEFVYVGTGSKQTNLPGPRYFNGRVSESEIYAGAINLAIGDRDFPIIYLKETTIEGGRGSGPKRLPAAVERLARDPFRPIIIDNRRVPPTRSPMRRVANYEGVIDKYTNVVNGGLGVEVGSIRTSWFKGVRIFVDSFRSGQGHEGADYVVTLNKGRLVYEQISFTRS